MPKEMTSGFLNEPLLHFVLIGILIFVGYYSMNRDGQSDAEIIVSVAQQQRLEDAFAVTWNRPPTNQELQSITDEWIREEIAYREAVAMGLDVDDTIVRRRLRQKLEILAEDIVSLGEPTKQELEQYLAENQADYRREARYSIQQVFFNQDLRGGQTRLDAERALTRLQIDGLRAKPETFGDPSPVPLQLYQEPEGRIKALLGLEFAQSLAKLERGAWQGPVRSAYGLHLVRIDEFLPDHLPELEEVEPRVKGDWYKEQEEKAIGRLYSRLSEKYLITIETASGEKAPR